MPVRVAACLRVARRPKSIAVSSTEAVPITPGSGELPSMASSSTKYGAPVVSRTSVVLVIAPPSSPDRPSTSVSRRHTVAAAPKRTWVERRTRAPEATTNGNVSPDEAGTLGDVDVDVPPGVGITAGVGDGAADVLDEEAAARTDPDPDGHGVSAEQGRSPATIATCARPPAARGDEPRSHETRRETR